MTSFARWKTKYIGDRRFYAMVLSVVVPMIIQNGISNLVNLLDNVMVGQLGTAATSGVAIVNQLVMIYGLCIFGAFSGAGIFSAQYFGQNDLEGVRKIFRLKLWFGVIITAAAIVILLLAGPRLIGLFLREGDGADAVQCLEYAGLYMKIMLFGLPGFTLTQIYASTLRESGKTVLPMKAGLTGVAVNVVFNYLLIYGKLGFPALGVAGAAAATVLSRYVEASIVVVGTHKNSAVHTFIKGMYRTLAVPADLIRKVSVKGAPLLMNEMLWSIGMALLLQCYSVRGLDVVAGMNIANTIVNIFNIIFITMGSAISIIAGQLLGADKMDEARSAVSKMIFFALILSIATAIVTVIFAPLFPAVYKTSELSKELAVRFIMVSAAFMPVVSLYNAAYFTIRSGGKTMLTFFFDSAYMYCTSIPAAFFLTRFTGLNVVMIMVIVSAMDIIKCTIGMVLIRKGIWLNRFVGSPSGIDFGT